MIDVPSAFERLTGDPAIIHFSSDGCRIPSGGHLQGIQRLHTPEEYFIISGSSDSVAYFIVVGRDLNGYRTIQRKIVAYEPYRHAGGIQVMDNYLVVGVEDNVKRDRSRLLFFDVGKPEEPIGDPAIAIDREGEEKLATAGAVAIAKRPDGYLLIVGSWDSDTLDFYASNGANIADAGCRFMYTQTWGKNNVCKDGWCDEIWGNYQNLNLMGDAEGRLYLLGYYCNENGEDYADLFSLDLGKPPSEMLKKEKSKFLKCKAGASFKYGGGTYIENEHSLVVYACERKCQDRTVINEFR